MARSRSARVVMRTGSTILILKGSAQERRLGRGFTGSLALLRRPPAVDQDVGAGDKTGRLRAQENGQRPDLLHSSPAAQRNSGNKLRVDLGILHESRVH